MMLRRSQPSMVPWAGLVLVLSGCAPPIYFAKAIHGRVVDAETQEPLPGTVVLAQWILYQPAPAHGAHGKRLHVSETVTDDHGDFRLPSWGPKLRPPLAYLDSWDPELLIYKHGFQLKRLFNQFERNTWIRLSEWDGETIALAPFRGTSKERGDQLLGILPIQLDRCQLRSVKALFSELEKERAFVGSSGSSFLSELERMKQGGP